MFLSGSTLSKMNQWIGSLPSTNQDDNFEWQFFLKFWRGDLDPKVALKKILQPDGQVYAAFHDDRCSGFPDFD